MRRLAILFTFILIAAACGGGDGPELAPATTDTAAPETAAPETEAPDQPLAGRDVGGGEVSHEDDAAHEGEMSHEDDAAHEGEMSHEDDAVHEDDHAVDPGEADRVVEIVMTELAFDPDTVIVTAGETVRFYVVNEGVIEHEFRLTTHHAAEEHIASGHNGHGDGGEGEGGHGHDEIVLLLQPGGSDVVDVAFHEAGEFDIVACLIPGHFEAGMHAPLEYSTT